MITALTRPVGRSIASCELTHLGRSPIDLELARRQHDGYEAALRDAGARVERLPDAPDLPDAVFVEDVAVVLPGLAVLTRPGAPSRRAERASVEPALLRHGLRLARIEPPATLDGGDVLRRGTTLFVGRSTRTGATAIAALRELAGPLGFEVVEVAVHGCLHLKSAVTALPDGRLLLQSDRIDVEPFGAIPRLTVCPDEPSAANVVSIADRVIHSASHPRTTARLREAGYDVRTVEMTELEKAEGAVTCCSLLLDGRPAPARAGR